MRIALGATAVIALLTLTGSSSALIRSGVSGVVFLSPATPVCVKGKVCERPAPGVVLRFKRSGHAAVQTTTGRGGKYSIRLAAGRYAVSAPKVHTGSGLRPRAVVIVKGRLGRQDFRLDSGIR